MEMSPPIRLSFRAKSAKRGISLRSGAACCAIYGWRRKKRRRAAALQKGVLVNAEAQALDGPRTQAACGVARTLVVGLDQHGVHLHVAGSHFKSRRQLVQKPPNDAV